jgi:hypothetical protein
MTTTFNVWLLLVPLAGTLAVFALTRGRALVLPIACSVVLHGLALVALLIPLGGQAGPESREARVTETPPLVLVPPQDLDPDAREERESPPRGADVPPELRAIQTVPEGSKEVEVVKVPDLGDPEGRPTPSPLPVDLSRPPVATANLKPARPELKSWSIEFDNRIRDNDGKVGIVTVTALWDTIDDVDLHVIDPHGNHFYYSAREFGTGKFDIDRNVVRESATNRPVENVRWIGSAPVGEYQVELVLYSSHTELKTPVRCLVRVQIDGKDLWIKPVELKREDRGSSIPIGRFQYTGKTGK